MKMLKEKQKRLLFALDHELEYMKTKLLLAQTLAKYPNKNESKHPVLNFAFTHAQTGIVEWLILRFSEAIIDFLEPASKQLLNEPLFTRAGRKCESKTKEIKYVLNLRNEYIAHRMVNLDKNSALQKKVIEEYGDIYNFLRSTIDILKGLLSKLEEKGLYNEVDNLSDSYGEVKEFTNQDIDDLVKLANSLIKMPNDTIRRTFPAAEAA